MLLLVFNNLCVVFAAQMFLQFVFLPQDASKSHIYNLKLGDVPLLLAHPVLLALFICIAQSKK